MDSYKRRTYRKKKGGNNTLEDIQINMYAFYTYLKVYKKIDNDADIINLFDEIDIKNTINDSISYYENVETLKNTILTLNGDKLKKLYMEFQDFIEQQISKLKKLQPGYLIYLLSITQDYKNYFIETVIMDNYKFNIIEPYKKDNDKYIKYKDYLGKLEIFKQKFIEDAYIESNKTFLDSFTYNS
jgi:hypothetical protein